MHTDRNRGKEGRDDYLFGSQFMCDTLKEAVSDVCYLLSRGYAEKSSVALVGNRYWLNARQQRALQGMVASEDQIQKRKLTMLSKEKLHGQDIIVDGFNVLIVLESALSGGYVFKGKDTCLRDLSGVHGTYKRVQQTEKVMQLVGNFLKDCGVKHVLWLLDKPVSNSGRLKLLLLEIAQKKEYNWEVDLEYSPDKILAESERVAISSDAWILNHAHRWFNLSMHIIENHVPEANLVYSE